MRNKHFMKAFALAICFLFLYPRLPIYASTGDDKDILTVKAAWTDGDMLKIDVIDVDGQASALALRLSDYVDDTKNSEYISVQAVDLAGNQSGVIQIKNPRYIQPQKENEPITKEEKQIEPKPTETTKSGVPEVETSLTPKGAASVLDNAKESDGKEFFTIDTEDGNVFYLIVDRQKNVDNVYLLNAVTETDLMALAEKSGKTIGSGSTSVISTPEPTPTITPIPEPTPEVETKPTQTTQSNSFYGMILFIVAIVGGVGYYLKVIKNKATVIDDEDWVFEEDENNEESMDMDNSEEREEEE